MSHLFLAMLAAICALFFGGAAFAHHRPSGLFGYTHDRIAFVGHAFGLVFALVAFASVIGLNYLVAVPFYGVAALMLLTAVLAPKLTSMSKPASNLVAYYGNCVGIAGVLCDVIFYLGHGPLSVAACAAFAFASGCVMLVVVGLRSSLTVRATPA